MWSQFVALRRVVRTYKLRRLATGLAVAIFSIHAAAAADMPAGAGQNTGSVTWGGLGWGLGVAADFDVSGSRVSSASVVNNIVRVTDSSGNVGLGFVLEAHYFLRDYEFGFATAAKKMVCVYYCNLDVGVGPFVAIEIGGGTSASPAANDPITGYALGGMVGFHHTKFDANNKPINDTSSWNFGVGLRVDPKAQVLGDGLTANQPLPAGDSIRYKTEPRLGIMLLSSFSF